MHRMAIRDTQWTENDVYVGRKNEKAGLKGHILGNPFPLSKAEWYNHAARLENVKQYRAWLWQRIKDRNKPILKALANLRPESVLVCYCFANQVCHADIIISAWHYCHEQGLIPAPVSPWTPPAVHPTQQRPENRTFLTTYKMVETALTPSPPRFLSLRPVVPAPTVRATRTTKRKPRHTAAA